MTLTEFQSEADCFLRVRGDNMDTYMYMERQIAIFEYRCRKSTSLLTRAYLVQFPRCRPTAVIW